MYPLRLLNLLPRINQNSIFFYENVTILMNILLFYKIYLLLLFFFIGVDIITFMCYCISVLIQ